MATYPATFREWLAKLIAFDTVSRNSNLPLVEYVRDYLQSVGVSSTLVYNTQKTHANLWATLPGEDGATQGGIVLSGHTDVVPVDGQKWDTDPFTMVEKDGKLYGRGTSDMKGFIAVCLALVPTFLSMKRAKPVHLAFSFNEEVNCTGVPFLIDYLKEKGFKADGCLIGEPTNMTVYTGNKGLCVWEVKVQGKAIHSSMALMKTSCNAIEYAAQIITKIREIALDIKKHGKRSQHDCPFACITTGLMQGGNAVNTVPAQCDFTFSVRLLDDQVIKDIEQQVSDYVAQAILPAMREEYPEASVDCVQVAMYPAFDADEHHVFTTSARHLCHDDKVRKTGGGTEAGFFQDTLHIPTVIVGPGQMEMAHVPNECISVEKMEECEKMVVDLINLYEQSSRPEMSAL